MEEKRKSMIIADDIEMMRSVLKKIFAREYDIYEAGSGIEVFEILAEHEIDVILLDIIMPDMDGLETLGKIREDDKYNSIAILVATSTKERTERKALHLGADDIISKPYDPVVVKKRVENIVERRSLIKAIHTLASTDDINSKEYLIDHIAERISSSHDKIDMELKKLERNGKDENTEAILKGVVNELKQLKAQLRDI